MMSSDADTLGGLVSRPDQPVLSIALLSTALMARMPLSGHPAGPDRALAEWANCPNPTDGTTRKCPSSRTGLRRVTRQTHVNCGTGCGAKGADLII